MTVLEYKISFATPAFLGNAEQQAQWRTPPFKALIRQWWRIAKAKDSGYDHKKMLAEEKYLFGTASEGNQTSECAKTLGRSKVQLRLNQWELGKQSNVDSGNPVPHKQVPSKQVKANLYLGYGPINNRDSLGAIAPYCQNKEEVAQLKIACPSDFQSEIQDAIRLASLFGTMGSRSRNGWGSVIIEQRDEQRQIEGFDDIVRGVLTSLPPMRRLEECLTLDWPHALGTDHKGPLVWRLLKPSADKPTYFESWKDVMHELACIKIAIRISENLEFNNGGRDGHPIPEGLHILAYPAGRNHIVKGWGSNGRLANQLRFKVHPYEDGFAGLIFHFPCGLPHHMAAPFKGQIPNQSEVWREVHHLLDRQPGLIRVKGAQK